MKEWRCGLTALSQRHNLYFVACTASIHIHRPSFPDQELLSGPIFILRLPTLQPPQLDEYQIHSGIDERDPHSINRLVVDYLGDDEILLAACDDGDAIVYRVEEILAALDNPTDASRQPIRVFLHRNVGASAWGIAVHREARLIAIGANTSKITIIALALTKKGDAHETDPAPAFVNGKPVLDFPTKRTRDHIFELRVGTNIPSVAFDNNGKDPQGRWLFCSSINGKSLVFDLHEKRLLSSIQVGWCTSTEYADQAPLSANLGCSCVDRLESPHAAWGAMFLDPLSAHDVSSLDELELERQETAPFFEDAGKQKQRFTMRTSQNSNTLDNTKAYCEILSFLTEDFDKTKLPSLIITKNDIFLIQPPRHSSTRRYNPYNPSKDPYRVIAIRQPLDPGPLQYAFGSHDRLCFSTQIRELGIFIVASPVGRVVIFSLTKHRSTHVTYGFKLEYILPFFKDHENDVVSNLVKPGFRLAGIAVSPVQGMLDGEVGGYDARKCGEGLWRLMMYYSDHTVVCYEIARKRKDGERGLGDLVV
jgi:hypothetical protein